MFEFLFLITGRNFLDKNCGLHCLTKNLRLFDGITIVFSLKLYTEMIEVKVLLNKFLGKLYK